MLTKRHPSVLATRLICLACGGQMPLKLVEPAYDGKPMDTHVFSCSNCRLTEAYLFPWIEPDGRKSIHQ